MYLNATQSIVVVNVSGNTTQVYVRTPAADPAESKDTSQRSTTENNTTTFSTLTPSNHKPQRNCAYLLKTAIATITTTDSEAEANILFDEGSQRSFLTQDLTNLLRIITVIQEGRHLSFILWH